MKRTTRYISRFFVFQDQETGTVTLVRRSWVDLLFCLQDDI
ncbi:hypothetical protein [Dyadobacter helix]|nr:hypothetical protein [Dyadobacter sp. CECT 9275]